MKAIVKLIPPLLALGILVDVWLTFFAMNGGLADLTRDPATAAFAAFRLAGLTAFTLLGFQVLTGPTMKLWERLYGPNFYRFHAYQGLFTLLFALLHPTLLLIYLWLDKIGYFTFAGSYPYQYYFGPLALFLMLVTVGTAAWTILFNKPRFQKSWHWIHLLNYLVFVLVFFHSLTIGTDVASPTSQLRPLWWFFAIGWLLGLLYRRIFRVVKERTHGLSS